MTIKLQDMIVEWDNRNELEKQHITIKCNLWNATEILRCGPRARDTSRLESPSPLRLRTARRRLCRVNGLDFIGK